ncbi:UbiA prenyltransferase family protein [bacterium]|nr:UbiA prenyltransferase family protein [bacterium]
MQWIKLLRVHQYVKNGFVFLPLFFALKFTDIPVIIQVSIAFIAFCFAASSVYILNDIKDLEEDRKHPKKKTRPIASGAISAKQAIIVMFILVISALAVASQGGVPLIIIISSYLLMNILYTYHLKHIALIDIFIIAIGFLLRLFSGTDIGGIATIHPSQWIIIMTFLLALFLGFAKRRDDVLLAMKGEKARKSIDGYNLEFINSAMSIMTAVIIVAYISYSLSPAVAEHFNSQYIYLTVIFVVLGMFRYLQITFVLQKSGSPTEVLLKDRILQLSIFLWIGSFVLLAY